MEKVEIYINECVKHLPKKHRKDVQTELQSEITSMIERFMENGDDQATAIDQVLNEMGDPKKLADQYLDRKAYLIGPMYYPTYLKVVKIVVLAVSIGLTVAFMVGALFNGATIVDFVRYISGMFNAGLMVVAWITVIFALIERNEKKLVELPAEDDWTVKDLPKSKDYKQKSDRIEGVMGLVFVSIMVVLFNFELDMLAVYNVVDGQFQQIAPIFNQQTVDQWLLWFNIGFALSIISNLIKAASIRHSKNKEIVLLVISAVSLVLFVWVFLTMNLFNPDLAIAITPDVEILDTMWQSFTNNIVWVIALIGMIDIISRAYRLIR